MPEEPTGAARGGGGKRPRVVFLGHPDVFEDFYPHYHVDQKAFALSWANTGNHAFIALIQREIGDVTWCEFSLAPELDESIHGVLGCRIRFFASSLAHRWLWRLFYLPRMAWRWRFTYPVYSLVASYLAPLSWHFLRTIWRERPDVILVQDYSTGRFDLLQILARACGARFAAYHAGSRPETYVGRALRRVTLPRADAIIVSSRGEAAMLAARFQVPQERMRTVLTPIDVGVFRPIDRTQACGELGLEPGRRYVLFVGRFDDRVKRVSALLGVLGRVMRSHPDVDAILIGDGADVDAVKTAAVPLGEGRCHLPGWVDSKHELALYYNAAEVLVLPSIREGFPTVVGEAMACGTPVIGSDVGGTGELVESGHTGWLVGAGDDAGLETALADALAHPDMVERLGTNALEVAGRRVSPEAVIAELRACLLGEDRG